jgi:hypothetical protein
MFAKKNVLVIEYENAKDYAKGVRKMTKKGYEITAEKDREERVGCMQILLFPLLIFRRNKVITVVTWELKTEETA